ncbi:FAD/NAD(P)-binding domain-containing protein [Pyrenochaeta sp. DS3sAY3a]|nr:FAD/NAD(P)-binding domain-containing protein [Pyrenochaeta sp. DS3sAY3a]
MAEQRNIVIVGASAAGLQTTHYILKHILPALKARGDAKYHVYNITPSAHFYFRVGSPRTAAAPSLLAADKIVHDLHQAFSQYSADDFTLIEGTATGLETSERNLVYKSAKGTSEEKLHYHALIVATGSSTYHPAFSASGPIQETLDALRATSESVAKAKSIVISGGGPTAVEFAGEVGEFRNGKPGWFSSPKPTVSITLLTADKQLLPVMRPAIAKVAENKLKALGVTVRYNSRVSSTTPSKDGRTIVTLGSGETIEADYYVPAYGVKPNSSWLPRELLDDKNKLIANKETFRVDAAGPRVYAFGDIASYSRNSVLDILNGLPVLSVNIKRDLVSFNPASPDAKPKGQDRLYKPEMKAMQIAPIGTGGGVGEVMGWKAPSFLVWAIKGRDYMVAMSGGPTASGKSVAKETKMTAEEAAY